MNKYLILGILAALLYIVWMPVNAGWYLEAGVTKNGIFQDWWEGRDSTGAVLGFGYVFHRGNLDIDVGWIHTSQWTRGNGFDTRDEHSNDSAGVIVRYEWR